MLEIMNSLRSFAAQGGSNNEADPWVISHAWIGKAILVTDEAYEDRRPTKPPALPKACEHFGISWLSPLDFLKRIEIRL